MAPPSHPLALVALLCAAIVRVAGSADNGGRQGQTRYDRVFSFGDWLTDTGNALRISDGRGTQGRAPYGMTFFGRPNGRASVARIAIDFIGEPSATGLARFVRVVLSV